MRVLLVVCAVLMFAGCADGPRCVDRLVPINAPSGKRVAHTVTAPVPAAMHKGHPLRRRRP